MLKLAITCLMLLSATAFSGGMDESPPIKDLKPGVFSFDEAVSLLRSKGVTVNQELAEASGTYHPVNSPAAGAPIKRVEFHGEVMSLDSALKEIARPYGFLYEIDSDSVITIYQPLARNLGKNYPLDKKIEFVVLHNTNVADAVMSIAKTYDIKICPLTLARHIPGKQFSIALKKGTVRDALNQIAKAAGLLGWNAWAGAVKTGPSAGDVVITVTW